MSFCIVLVFKNKLYSTTQPVYTTCLPRERFPITLTKYYERHGETGFDHLSPEHLVGIQSYSEACQKACDVFNFDQWNDIIAAKVMDEDQVNEKGIDAPVLALVERDRQNNEPKCGTCSQKFGGNK